MALRPRPVAASGAPVSGNWVLVSSTSPCSGVGVGVGVELGVGVGVGVWLGVGVGVGVGTWIFTIAWSQPDCWLPFSWLVASPEKQALLSRTEPSLTLEFTRTVISRVTD